MQSLLTSTTTTWELDPNRGNRLSVNIAPGGSPYTKAQLEGGNLVNADGMQMAAGYNVARDESLCGRVHVAFVLTRTLM